MDSIVNLDTFSEEQKTYTADNKIERNIIESTCTKLIFNVMPNRDVEEKLYIKEYKIGKDYIEAIFDREYISSMAESPSHLIFLTALVHMQKMIYVYMCDYLDKEYDPYGPEILKVWPTSLDIQMPKLITQSKDLCHQIHIQKIRKLKEKVYHITAETNINNIITVNGMTMVYLI